MSSAALDPKAAALTQQLDKLDDDLAGVEDSMLSRLRAPLSRTDPSGDLANRLREQEVTSYISCVIHLISCLHVSAFILSVSSSYLGEMCEKATNFARCHQQCGFIF